jgi:hypothetical protein
MNRILYLDKLSFLNLCYNESQKEIIMNKIIIYAKTNHKIFDLYLDDDTIIINCLLTDYSSIQQEMQRLFPDYHYMHYVDYTGSVVSSFYSANADDYSFNNDSSFNDYSFDEIYTPSKETDNHEREKLYYRIKEDIRQIKKPQAKPHKKRLSAYGIVLIMTILLLIGSQSLVMISTSHLKAHDKYHIYRVFNGYMFKEYFKIGVEPRQIPDELIAKYKLDINKNLYVGLDEKLNIIDLSYKSNLDHYYSVTFLQNNHRYFYAPKTIKCPKDFPSNEHFAYVNNKSEIFSSSQLSKLRADSSKKVTFYSTIRKYLLFIVLFLMISHSNITITNKKAA